MEHSESEKEKSSDFETFGAFKEFDTIIENINQDPLMNEINQKVDEKVIEPKDDKFCKEQKIKPECNSCSEVFRTFIFRIVDTFFFIILSLSFVFLFLAVISFVFEVTISYYSVIMMNYVFFVSSIVSYVMAPIYQSLSFDWLNFSFSYTQVILASPLIGFYIFYISKSVVSLASFISDIPSVIQHITIILTKGKKTQFKELFTNFFSDFFWDDTGLIFKKEDIKKIFILFFASLGSIVLATFIAYIEFCFDKTVIVLGSICYVINTVQIFILVLPSYLYFFQTLFFIKCKEIQCVKSYIKKLKHVFEKYKDKSVSEKSISEESDDNQTDSNESNSDDSVSFVNNRFNNNNNNMTNEIDEENNNNNNNNDIKKKNKFIDDSDISDFVDDEHQATNKFDKVINMLLHLITANSYFCLYRYSKTIAFDKHKKCRKVTLMYFFFLLNLGVISYDIYKLLKDYSVYYLASIIIRFILIPLLSYYNIFSIAFHRSKNLALNIVLGISSVLTIVIAIAIFLCFLFTDFYQNKYRINDLSYVPLLKNYSVADEEMLNHPICDYKMFNISAFDAFGYSLGGYDVKRNKTVFDNQMKIFFDENYSNHISYKIHELDKHFLFLQYYDSSIDTHIFAFRGYNSGPEVAFQLELLATHYIIPFFEDIVPFYELINDYWLEFYTDFLNSFGLQFFDNNNLMVKYVHSIVDIYNKANLEDEKRVLFAGINCGGVFAKILGTILHRKSISFISFPIDNDLFETMFDFSKTYISLATNVYNVEGFFSAQEPRYATNIGIELPVFESIKYCTSGICGINSKTDNVYRTFCTMSEICGKGNRFNYYCENVIGELDVKTIRESLKDND